MAEIPIQRKEGNNIWPWIIGILAVVALVWYFVGRDRTTTNGAVIPDTAATAPAAGTPATGTPATGTPATGTPATPNP